MNINDCMFDFVYSTIRGEGGDGWAWLICKHDNPKDVALKFQEWAKTTYNTSYEMVESKDDILLLDGQENVVFSSSDVTIGNQDLLMNDCIVVF